MPRKVKTKDSMRRIAEAVAALEEIRTPVTHWQPLPEAPHGEAP